MLFAGFYGRFAVCVELQNPLKTAVGKKLNLVARTFEIFFENLEIVRTSLVLSDCNHFVVCRVRKYQSFDCMALFLA